MRASKPPRTRNPSPKALENFGTMENIKQIKKASVEEKDIIYSQMLDISDDPSQILGGNQEPKTETDSEINEGTCSMCKTKEKGFDCGICLESQCQKCDKIKEGTAEWHYYYYQMRTADIDDEATLACWNCRGNTEMEAMYKKVLERNTHLEKAAKEKMGKLKLEIMQRKIIKELTEEKINMLEELTKLNKTVAEKDSEIITLKERLLVKDKPENREEREPTLGDGMEPVSDAEEEFDDDELAYVPERNNEIKNISSKNIMTSIGKGFEMCKNRSECTNETVEVGIKCRKLHIEEREYKKNKGRSKQRKRKRNQHKETKRRGTILQTPLLWNMQI